MYMILPVQAPSKDVVKDVCVQSHRAPSRRLTETTAATFNVPTTQASQVRSPDDVCVSVSCLCLRSVSVLQQFHPEGSETSSHLVCLLFKINWI